MMHAPGQTVRVTNSLTIPENPDPDQDRLYHAKQSYVLGILEVICGILNIIFNVVALAVVANWDPDYYHGYRGCPGIWCGALFILAGAFSLVAGRNKNTCMIGASLGLNITTNVFAGILFLWSCTVVIADDVAYTDYYGIVEYDHDMPKDVLRVTIAMGALMLLLSVMAFVVTTWLYVLGCMSSCRSRPQVTTTVITTHNGPVGLPQLPTTQIIQPPGYNTGFVAIQSQQPVFNIPAVQAYNQTAQPAAAVHLGVHQPVYNNPPPKYGQNGYERLTEYS